MLPYPIVPRILYASERPPYPFFQGGAARSAHYLMSTLAKEFEVECLAIGSKDFANSVWSNPEPGDYASLGISEITHTSGSTSIRCGYSVQLVENFENSLIKTIDDFAPDVVWTQLDGVSDIARIAHDRGRRVLVYLRDAEDAPAMLKSLAAAGCCIVCNSQFMAKRIRRITGKSACVIYPSLEADFNVNGDPQGYITMINPYRVKGIDTFLEIASRMPAEQFLLVESWTLDGPALAELKEKLASFDNVHFLRRVPGVQEIYQQTKLLLVPSVWEEAFGRVVIEAQSCKIPVIASMRGGLPEAVGEGGGCVRDFLNADAWVSEIQRVLNDNETYQSLAKKAHTHANREAFSIQCAARRFLNICMDSSCYNVPYRYTVRNLFARMRHVLST